jgi:transcriptional regulator with XRE-family HTH domain
MNPFSERLRMAARHAGIEDHQSGIAAALSVGRQTVNRWFKGTAGPNARMLLQIAGTFGVHAEWLRSGDGAMLPEMSDGLTPDEREMLKNYRMASSHTRKLICAMVRAARNH